MFFATGLGLRELRKVAAQATAGYALF